MQMQIKQPRAWRVAKAWAAGIMAACICLMVFSVDDTAPRAIPPGSVYDVIMPVGKEARSTALLIFGQDGWTEEHSLRAARLSELHTLVIGVNGPALRDGVGGRCTDLAWHLAEIARTTQQREGALPRAPVLAALADGADLALAVADAAPERFKGLVTQQFGTAEGICLSAGPTLDGGKAPVRWLDVIEPGSSSRAAALNGTKIIEADVGLRKAFYRSYLGVAGTDSAFAVAGDAQPPEVADLPLTIHYDANAPAQDSFAILLSGDGGWAKFDEEVADRLAAKGIPVVGISSLRYMWRKKEPSRIAADLARIGEVYGHKFGRQNILLIGFSLGANTLPFAVQELPPRFRDRIAGVGLIAPETLTGFEIVIGGWLGGATGATEVAPAIAAMTRQIPPERVACLHGAAEEVSACPVAQAPGMHSVVFEGGHHLGHDHDRIVEVLMGLTESGV